MAFRQSNYEMDFWVAKSHIINCIFTPLPRNRKCVAQCGALIFLMSVIYGICRVERCHPRGGTQSGTSACETQGRNVCLMASAAHCKTAASLSGREKD